MSEARLQRVVGRYAVYDRIASGGMASVHLGRLLGPVGFSRLVAIKVLHPNLSRDPAFVAMFLDEARIAARIRHPNVIPTLDIDAADRDLFLVMEYVEGESAGRLLAKTVKDTGAPPAAEIAAAIVHGALAGLHAAHQAQDEHGRTLNVVHRDVSPQNILVGVDGVPRVLDFGVAKAMGRLQTTQAGQLKGKLPYMAPEQVRTHAVDARTDVWGASVVLWELLTGSRLFSGEEMEIVSQVFKDRVPAPSSLAPGIPPALDAVVLRGLAMDPARRFSSAAEMAQALEAALPLWPAAKLGQWVRSVAAQALAERASLVARVEASPPPRVSEPTSPERASAEPLPRAPAGVPTAPPVDETPVSAKRQGRDLASLSPTLLLVGGMILGGVVVGLAIGVSGVKRTPADRVSTAHPRLESAAPSGPPTAPAPSEAARIPDGIAELDSSPPPAVAPSELPPPRSSTQVNKLPPSSSARTKTSCENPFYYEKGIKKFKPECLRP